MHLYFLVTLDLWGLWKTPSFWELCNKETIFEGNSSQHIPPKFVLCVTQNIEVRVCGNRTTIFPSTNKLRACDALAEMHRSSLGLFFPGPLGSTGPFLWNEHYHFLSELRPVLWFRTWVTMNLPIMWQSLSAAPRVTWPAPGSRGGCECNMGMTWECLCGIAALRLLLSQLLTPAPITPSPYAGSLCSI